MVVSNFDDPNSLLLLAIVGLLLVLNIRVSRLLEHLNARENQDD